MAPSGSYAPVDAVLGFPRKCHHSSIRAAVWGVVAGRCFNPAPATGWMSIDWRNGCGGRQLHAREVRQPQVPRGSLGADGRSPGANLSFILSARPTRTDEDLVFCHPHSGNVLDPSKMRKRFEEAIARAGVREITFHELRHTFGTQMAAAGASLPAPLPGSRCRPCATGRSVCWPRMESRTKRLRCSAVVPFVVPMWANPGGAEPLRSEWTRATQRVLVQAGIRFRRA
jgi:hypothetical protein